MRSSRLLSIQILLQSRGRMSARALANALEVSERTIYRDIDALSAAGVPIYAEPGRHGGVALLEGYHTRLTGLTPGEAAAMPFAGLIEAARALGISAAAQNAQLKMLASLPSDSAARAAWIGARFHMDPIAWRHRAEPLPLLPRIAEAVWREQRVRIHYESWKSVAWRTIDPLGLVQKGGLWYLVAAARQRPSVFRIASILNFEALDAAARRPKQFDLATFWRAWARDFETRLAPTQCIVRISPEGRRILRAVQPTADDMIAASAEPDGPRGWVRALFPVETPAYTARQILRLGAEIEVLSPTAMRAAVAKEAAQVVAHYRRKRPRA
jgi:predicted DNA-binding transcriptional regulator YafY